MGAADRPDSHTLADGPAGSPTRLDSFNAVGHSDLPGNLESIRPGCGLGWCHHHWAGYCYRLGYSGHHD